MAIPLLHTTGWLNLASKHSPIDEPKLPAFAAVLLPPPAPPTPRLTLTRPRRVRLTHKPLSLAQSEMLAASKPAPLIPLTREETLLLRALRASSAAQLATLNPVVRARQDAEGNAEFCRFFGLTPGENQ